MESVGVSGGDRPGVGSRFRQQRTRPAGTNSNRLRKSISHASKQTSRDETLIDGRRD